MLVISKGFAKSEFQTFEPNFKFGAVNELTIELLQTSLQHFYSDGLIILYISSTKHS